MDSLLPFAGVSALIVLTPGPDLMLVTRNVLAAGRRSGVLTALGITTGSAVWAVAAAGGLAALFKASLDLLVAIRWLGAGYLAWIGIRALVTLGGTTTPRAGGGPLRARSGTEPFRMGLINNLLHPGQVVFYAGLLPQFIDKGANPTAQALGLGVVFVAIVLSWFVTYAILASNLRSRRLDIFAPAMTRITGLILIGFAVRLAA